MKRLLLFILTAMSLLGQGSAVNQVLGPPPDSWVSLYFYSGSSVTYICYAHAQNDLTSYITGGSPGLTSIVVVSNVGTINFPATAQLWQGQTVTVSASGTAALNATYKITAVSGSTATITTSGVGDATYNTAGMTLATNGPVLDALKWSIQVFAYSGTNVISSYFAGTPRPTPQQNLACANRANY